MDRIFVVVYILFKISAFNIRSPCNFSLYRNVYERANRELKSADDKEERLMLLESWKQFEVRHVFILWIVQKMPVCYRRINMLDM